jgi:hypothetical protein
MENLPNLESCNKIPLFTYNKRKEEEEIFVCRVKSSVWGGGEKQSQTKGHELYAL